MSGNSVSTPITTNTPSADPALERRVRLFRSVTIISGVASAAMVLALIVLWVLVPQRLFPQLISAIALFAVLALVSFWINQRGRYQFALLVYMVALNLVLFTIMYFFGGTTGPLAMILVAVSIIAGVLAGRYIVRWAAFSTSVVFGIFSFIEWIGILPATTVGENIERWAVVGFVSVTSTALGLIVGSFSTQVDDVLQTSEQRRQALEVASRRAEQAALAEREMRQRELQGSQQLRATVRDYVAFLERVSSGDYGARLDLETQEEEGVEDLRVLGQYLNSTVDTLVNTLSDIRAVQQRYTAQSWTNYVKTQALSQRFHYTGDEVISDDQAWVPSMDQVLDDGVPVIAQDELAVPVVVNQQVIGVIGARRTEERSWSEEEASLVTDVVTQLAQTVESLRLFDETQRNVAREQVLGQVSGRIRQELEIQDVLRTAVDEIQDALGLSAIAIRMMPEDLLALPSSAHEQKGG